MPEVEVYVFIKRLALELAHTNARMTYAELKELLNRQELHAPSSNRPYTIERGVAQSIAATFWRIPEQDREARDAVRFSFIGRSGEPAWLLGRAAVRRTSS